MDVKPWYQSKVVWLNVITTVIAVLSLFGTETLSFMTPQVTELVLFSVAVLNVLLRVWFTSEPVTARAARAASKSAK
jgi:hypothetical protein